ncbi:bifunctional diguanylate cyclase/phosphodiesterase [Thalassomonas haliotis]|uniref:EAL domain-containing protein n=1 Tax=Thalassomonas haliotis TaxID=485448 RepID=A0ABY7VEY1_9GAMM|nr:EAL domain-containing protein [Thalassomonas haliotis]WDE11453.1 EAL domain-containing protein [Thalassomonas haliotis]
MDVKQETKVDLMAQNLAVVDFDLEKLACDVIDKSDIGIFILGRDKNIVCWNNWMAQMSGIKADNATGKSLEQLFTGFSNLRLEQAIDDALLRGMSAVLSQKFNPHSLPLYKSPEDRKKKQLMSQMIMVKPIHNGGHYSLVQVIDVSPASARDKMLRHQADEYKHQELHTRAILSSIADAVITLDVDGRVDYMNIVAEKLTGWSFQQALGLPWKNVLSVIDKKEPLRSEPVRHCLQQGQAPDLGEYELELQPKSGANLAIELSMAPICDQHSETLGVVAIFRDVTNARQLAQQINWQASHDTLTALLNRRAFDDKLAEMVKTVRHQDGCHALLYLDLDRFKIVNDTCGHAAGDELLKQIARLLASNIRANDLLARLGGDEFGIQLLDCPAKAAANIANMIRIAIQQFRFSWGEKIFNIGVSIGVVEVTPRCKSAEDILCKADAACYAAKKSGRDQVHFYRSENCAAVYHQGEMEWFPRIQQALAEDRFTLYAQKIVPLADMKQSKHFEVLVRMLDADAKLIPPGEFIPAAERFGLMPKIDQWVICHVFKLIASERARLNGQGYHFAINLSGCTLSDEQCLAFIKEQLAYFNIPPGMISFEITETAAISNLSSVNHFIRNLQQSGCRLSLDDFGSGLSSFAYLKNLPVDFLKIDGLFVKNMAVDAIDRAMVKSINEIGHVMQLKTIAEFVENDAIIASLEEIGVDYLQGYGIAPPQPLTDANGRLQLT